MSTKVDDWTGRKLKGRNGTYAVRSFLGGGGMASVYLATDKQGRDVALKIPREAILQEDGFGARFVREVRLLMKFNHPHVLKVFDVSEDGETPFVAMQYLALGSLRLQQPCDEKTGDAYPMRPDEISPWLRAVADALDYVHKNGFVHRDVKPENIMFDAEGNAYLGDFGIIKVRADARRDTPETVATGTGMVLGTPYYMAPELLMGEVYDGRADQYSLGVTVYELLAAHVPFTGEAPVVFVGHMTKTPPRIAEFVAGFPKSLEDVVQRAMAKKPSARYPNCRAFADAFEAATAAIMGSRSSSGKIGSSKSDIALPALSVPPQTTPKPAVSAPRDTGLTCPYCQWVTRLPQGVRSRTLRCGRCRKVYSTTANVPSAAETPTSKQEQAKIDTRPEERRRPAERGKGKPPSARRQPAKPALAKIAMFVGGGLFVFSSLVAGIGAAANLSSLAVVFLILALLWLFVGMGGAIIVVLRRPDTAAVAKLCRECEQALVERRYADVLRSADQAIALDPRCARAYMQRGFAHAKRREYQNALADLDRAIELDDSLADAYAARAHVYRNTGDEERARADERRANEINRK